MNIYDKNSLKFKIFLVKSQNMSVIKKATNLGTFEAVTIQALLLTVVEVEAEVPETRAGVLKHKHNILYKLWLKAIWLVLPFLKNTKSS